MSSRGRRTAQALADSAVWFCCLVAACFIRFDFSAGEIAFTALVALGALAALSQVLAGIAFGLYVGRWRFGSFEEVSALGKTASVTTLVLLATDLLPSQQHFVPASVPLIAGLTGVVTMGSVRYVWRAHADRARRPDEKTAQRTIVIGAGEGGAQIITAMLRHPNSSYFPVALLDDDPAKRNLRIRGVRVVGDRFQLAAAAERWNASVALIALPSAGPELVSELTEIATVAGLTTKVLPPVDQIFARVSLDDIRDVELTDLLGRHQVETDLVSIAGYLTGKRVLVTGAGGSIGSELCRQINQFGPSELMMLDRDESALHAVQLSIEGRALLDSPNLILLDIRDELALRTTFERRRPEVVFHAAALKHLTLLEQHPREAIRSNVWGTLGVLEAAVACGVDRFVNISTDKAADPTSVLGYSKRIAERLTAHMATQVEGVFLSVRFGNVLGSRGSMLGTFQAQIDAGGPVTVTDKDVTRYFMTIPEAVQLVIQAGAIGRPGEALVLDMGQPVRIADVAEMLVDRAVARGQRRPHIVFTGLRPGEKLHECLLGDGEEDARPRHPQISQVPVPPIEPGVLADPELDAPVPVLIDWLRSIACSVESWSSKSTSSD